MNNAAITPYICMHALQIQNVKRNVAKKASIKELNHEIYQPIETQEEIIQQNNENVNQEINDNNDNNDNNRTNIVNLPEPIINETGFGSEI